MLLAYLSSALLLNSALQKSTEYTDAFSLCHLCIWCAVSKAVQSMLFSMWNRHTLIGKDLTFVACEDDWEWQLLNFDTEQRPKPSYVNDNTNALNASLFV